MAEKMFPVLLGYGDRQRLRACPWSVPWAFLAPHEGWANANHGQSLEQLAQRGGLDPTEMLAVVEHRRWRGMWIDDAVVQLNAALALWAAENHPSKESAK